MRQVIITADDFGIAAETNLAVETAHRHGVLTSASIMANMPAFEDAVAVARRNPGLGIGVHLSLTSGKAVLPAERVPLLVDKEGLFRHGYVALSRLVLGTQRLPALRQVAAELAAQIEKVIRTGLDIDHLDGHRHVHMIPAIWQIVSVLGIEYGVPVRFATERPNWSAASRRTIRNLMKAAVLHACAQANGSRRVADVQFAGLMDSGCVNVRVLRRLLVELPPGTTEIVTHPSLPLPSRTVQVCCSKEDEIFLRSRGRQSELDALVHTKVRSCLDEQKIRPLTFRMVSGRTQQAVERVVAC